MKSLLLIILTSLVAGCSGIPVAHLTPASRELISTSNLFEKNYVINREKTAPVGSPIVKLFDYYLNKYTLPEVVSNKDTQITVFIDFSTHTANLAKGQVYKIISKSSFKGRDVYVLDVVVFRRGLEIDYLVADSSGVILPIVYNTILGGFVENYKLKNTEAADISFRFVETTSPSQKGSVNFELIYTGIQNENITILYREYTADDMARPAFHQNLFFPSKDKVVRFNKIRIEVVSATSEFLKYIVRED